MYKGGAPSGAPRYPPELVLVESTPKSQENHKIDGWAVVVVIAISMVAVVVAVVVVVVVAVVVVVDLYSIS